jgi:hypothetical protein
VQTATGYVLQLDGWIKKNQGLTQTLGVLVGVATGVIAVIGAIGLVAFPVIMGINAIIAAAGVLGTVFSVVGGAIVTALGALTLPIVAVGAAVVAGALLIRKYWEPISAFFSGVIEGLTAAFAPVGEMFSPLKPMFDWLGEKLKAAWDWFRSLLEPVKSSRNNSTHVKTLVSRLVRRWLMRSCCRLTRSINCGRGLTGYWKNSALLTRHRATSIKRRKKPMPRKWCDAKPGNQ